MTDNYASISHWGMFPTCDAVCSIVTPNVASQFKEGYEAALGIHLLEGVN